jgi:hypothetical protein
VEVVDADSNRKILCLHALHFYIFRGRGTDPTIGFNDAERLAHEETNRCLSARGYLDRRCDG